MCLLEVEEEADAWGPHVSGWREKQRYLGIYENIVAFSDLRVGPTLSNA